MNGLPNHVQQVILALKARRGTLEKDIVILSDEISSRSSTKQSKQEKINQIGQAIFVLECEGKTFPTPPTL